MRGLACATLCVMGCLALPALAAPAYKLDRTQSRVVSLSGLSSGGMCKPFRTSGRVTEQNFSGPRVTGFTLAEAGGTRIFVNVEPVDLNNAGNMLAVGWINEGLQKLLRKGSRVSVRVDACGAAGRVLVLDSVKPR